MFRSTLSSLTAPQRIAALLLAGSMVFSLAGSLLLQFFPVVAGYVGAWYVTLVKAPTWTYMTAMAVLALVLYAPEVGWRRVLLMFAAGSLIGGSSELIGTSTGYPFGPYGYTAWLGPKFMDHVPYFIPPSWFAMSIVSWDLAGRIGRSAWTRVPVTALFMVLWDVSLDPAMSRAFPFWTYPEGGFYYGMPWTNWIGWFVVTLVIASAYELIMRGGVPRSRWAGAYYVLNCAFPILLSFVFGLPWAAVIGIAATAVPFALQRMANTTADVRT